MGKQHDPLTALVARGLVDEVSQMLRRKQFMIVRKQQDSYPHRKQQQIQIPMAIIKDKQEAHAERQQNNQQKVMK